MGVVEVEGQIQLSEGQSGVGVVWLDLAGAELDVGMVLGEFALRIGGSSVEAMDSTIARVTGPLGLGGDVLERHLGAFELGEHHIGMADQRPARIGQANVAAGLLEDVDARRRFSSAAICCETALGV